jgi:hypothetical protein
LEIAINRRGAEKTLRNSVRLLAGPLAALAIAACSSAPAPLSIVLEHPETKHTLTCAAKDKLGRTDESVLAGVVENCARTLEARGYVRQR